MVKQNTRKNAARGSSRRLLIIVICVASILILIAGGIAFALGLLGGPDSHSGSAHTQAELPGDTKEENGSENSEEQTTDTLTAAVDQNLEGRFSPFTAASSADRAVADSVTLYTLTLDRTAGPVYQGITGEIRDYKGTSYTYTGPADMTVTANEDGTVSYDIRLREDLTFSDGVPVTADDVIFSLYVLLDPTYDGDSVFHTLPIQGLEEYRANVYPLYRYLISAGRDNTDFTYWDEETQNAFWDEGLPAAGEAFANSILQDCIVRGYASKGDPVDVIAPNWGFEVPAGATAADFWNVMVDAYEGNYQRLSNIELASGSLWSYLDPMYCVGITAGESAPGVSGIQRLDDHTVRIVTSYADASVACRLRIPIAPLHYYGDTAQYHFEQNQFGFPKGDLTLIKEKNGAPLGAGPYVFGSREDGVVHLDANPGYYKGAPQIAHLDYREASEAEKITGIGDGTLDVSAPAYTLATARQAAVANGLGEEEWETTDGAVLTTRLTDYCGYGYVGINPNLVKVGEDPASGASRALRKAIAVVIAACRQEGIGAYYGSAAEVIDYPISNTSWAAPRAGEEGYRTAYSLDVNGSPIYTDGMSPEERYSAAKNAALGYLQSAGYTVTDGRVTAAPEGASMSYECVIKGGGTGDHPSYHLMELAKAALADIGLEITITDYAYASDLYGSYQNGSAPIWCAAWRSYIDPDMYQVYHSQGTTNYYRIADEELDGLIMSGRQTLDQSARRGIYKEAMEIVMDWAVEVPVYQRSECRIFSTERVDLDTVPGNMTSFWDWTNEIEKLKLK